jgi:creatinine amidohydrolase
MPFVEWSTLSWTEAEALGRDERTIGLIPLGALEQHGPHLPLATDSLIIEPLAAAVADRIAGPVVVTPVVTGGLSEHHRGFPGTMTLDVPTFRATIVALLDAFERTGIRRAALISSHGGNFAFLGDLVHDWADVETMKVVAFSDLTAYLQAGFDAAGDLGIHPPRSDIHAGAIETGLAQHLFPELVRDGWQDVTGLADSSPELLGRVLTEGVHSVSPSGVLGDPALATPELGGAVFERLRDDLAAWLVHEFDLAFVDAVDA